MLFCFYEDRLSHWVGLELAVLSLSHHCPSHPILISLPDSGNAVQSSRSNLQSRFRHLPNVRVVVENFPRTGWDVKPTLLLRRLAEGYEDVVWMDSDIIVAGALPQRLTLADPSHLVIAEESYWAARRGPWERPLAWGMEPGRLLPGGTVNSSVVRVTRHHRQLLEAWEKLLGTSDYRTAQTRPWPERPFHLVGDQDVLAAILSSREFMHVPVTMLRRGVDIAQCLGPSGFTAAERWRIWWATRQPPPLVHAQGVKPWEIAMVANPNGSVRERARTAFDRAHAELHPYRLIALRYARQLGEVPDWLHDMSITGRLLGRATSYDPVLMELPLALLHSALRHVNRIFLARSRVRSVLSLHGSLRAHLPRRGTSPD